MPIDLAHKTPSQISQCTLHPSVLSRAPAARKSAGFSLLRFQREFAKEEACLLHLFRMRWPKGFNCPKCGHSKAWIIHTRNVLDCKSCRAKISVTAGTIFHKTHVPLVKWYWLIYHMAMDKTGVSISEMQRLLEIKSYKTAWLMAHKVRKAMKHRVARHSLVALVEIDHIFFAPGWIKAWPSARGKSKVLCAVFASRNSQGELIPHFARMRHITGESTEAVVQDFMKTLDCDVHDGEGKFVLEALRRNGWRPYRRNIAGRGVAQLRVIVSDCAGSSRILPWVHCLISNVNAVIRGAHRGVSEKHFQSYLGEICYRLNRRFLDNEIFDSLVEACLCTANLSYRQLVRGKV
jgi:hypothetical protein